MEAFVGALMEHAAIAVPLQARVLAPLGLGLADVAALDRLARDGPLTAGELGAATGLASASVTGLIDRLEASGVARRVRDPDDGRRVRVEVSPAGMRRIGRAFAGAGLDLAQLAAPYTDAELTRVATVLHQVSAAMRAVLARPTAERAARAP